MNASLDTHLLQELLQTAVLGRDFRYYASAGSTQDIARSLTEGGAPEGVLVFAEEQTSGRGRMGRVWESPAFENIYATLVLRPAIAQLRMLAMLAPLAIAEAVEETHSLAPVIKWPNDVLCNGRKFAGVLIETTLRESEADFLLLGLGVNVNMDVARQPGISAIATSIRSETGHTVSRERLLAAILGRLEKRYHDSIAGQSPLPAWRQRLETLGRRVQVRQGAEMVTGIAEDVDAEGRLLVRRSDGALLAFAAGDVSLRAG